MQLEYKKQNPNLEVVNELMVSTFALRRKDILNNPCDLRTLLDKYPFLRTIDQVHVFIVQCACVKFFIIVNKRNGEDRKISRVATNVSIQVERISEADTSAGVL